MSLSTKERVASPILVSSPSRNPSKNTLLHLHAFTFHCPSIFSACAESLSLCELLAKIEENLSSFRISLNLAHCGKAFDGRSEAGHE